LLEQADDGDHSAHCVWNEVLERFEHSPASVFRRIWCVAQRCGHATAAFAAIIKDRVDAGNQPAIVMKRGEYGPVQRKEAGPVRQVSGKTDLDFSGPAAGAQEIDSSHHVRSNGIHLIEVEHFGSFAGDRGLGPCVDRRGWWGRV